ncbi:MAG: amino acid racemase [Gammaproteobacteria bacterium]|nr:amino acid racemase [Gammaproteobacteria bacterium]
MTPKRNPIIGIIGGTGPDATIDIQLKIARQMKAKLQITKDQDYFGVIVNNDCQIADRSHAILGNHQELLQLYAKRARELENLGADILIVACNTVHIFLNELQSMVTTKILNIVEETAKYFTAVYPEISRVGILSTLGTSKSGIYQNIFSNYGIEVVSCDFDILKKVHQAIYGIKAGYIDDSNLLSIENRDTLKTIYSNCGADKTFALKTISSPRTLIIEALQNIKNKGVFHTILGCTDLPLAIISAQYKQQVLIDPNLILASSAVDYCISCKNESQIRHESIYSSALSEHACYEQ